MPPLPQDSSTVIIGRLRGITEKQKHCEDMKIVAAKNKICKTYQDKLTRQKVETAVNGKVSNFPTGRLDEIIQEVKKKRKISESVIITKKTNLL